MHRLGFLHKVISREPTNEQNYLVNFLSYKSIIRESLKMKHFNLEQSGSSHFKETLQIPKNR